jgi:amino acid transporter
MTETSTAPRLTNKKLTTIDCVAQSLAVGPIFSAGVLGAILALLSGGVGLLVIVLTTIGILAIGWIVSELAKKYSGSGTVYEAIAHTLGKPVGVFAAMLYYIAITALVAALPVAGGVFLKLFCDAHLGFNPPWWLAALVMAGLMYGFNALGIQASVKTQLALIVGSALPFVILFIAVVIDGGPDGNTLSALNPGNVAEGGSIFKGVLFSILMFIGFEWSAALGEETEHPKHSIPLAVLLTILICGAFYIITQYTLSVGQPELGPFNVFVPLANDVVGTWLGTFIELAVLLDLVAVGVGITAAASRGFFTLARDGLLPASLSKTDRRDVPIVATTGILGAMLLVILITLIKYGTDAVDGFPNAFTMFLILAVTGGMLICVIYALLCLGGLKTLITDPRAIVAGVVGLVVAIGGILAQFIDGTAPLGDALWGRHLGLILIVLVGAWLAYNGLIGIDRSQHFSQQVRE